MRARILLLALLLWAAPSSAATMLSWCFEGGGAGTGLSLADKSGTDEVFIDRDCDGVQEAGDDWLADILHSDVDGEINALTDKASPVGADVLIIEDSAASFAKKKVSITNLPGGADADAIHDNVAQEIQPITVKGTPVGADVILIEDSADSWNKKSVAISTLPGGGGGDNVSIDGAAATDPDFTSDGDLDAIRCTAPATPDASCVAAEDVIYRYNPTSIDNTDIAAAAAIVDTKLENIAAWTLMLNNSAGATSRADVKISALTDRTVFGSGDKMIIEESTGELRKVDYDDLPGAGGGMSSFEVQGDDGAPNVSITDGNVLQIIGGAGIQTEDGDAGADTLTITTLSTETGFLAATAGLGCGVGTLGQAGVHATQPFQYCDNAGTPSLKYAAFGGSDGRALAGDTATSFFNAGTIEVERGGTEQDSSGWTGVPEVTAGVWSNGADVTDLAGMGTINDGDFCMGNATSGIDCTNNDVDLGGIAGLGETSGDLDPDRIAGDTTDDDLIDTAVILNTSGTNTGDESLSSTSAGLDVSDHVVDLDVTPGTGSPTLEQSDDALQVKYDSAVMAESASGLGIAASSLGSAELENDFEVEPLQFIWPDPAATDVWVFFTPPVTGTIDGVYCRAIENAKTGTAVTFTIKICDGDDTSDDTCDNGNLLDSTETTTLTCTEGGASDVALNTAEDDYVAGDLYTIVLTAVSATAPDSAMIQLRTTTN